MGLTTGMKKDAKFVIRLEQDLHDWVVERAESISLDASTYIRMTLKTMQNGGAPPMLPHLVERKIAFPAADAPTDIPDCRVAVVEFDPNDPEPHLPPGEIDIDALAEQTAARVVSAPAIEQPQVRRVGARPLFTQPLR